MEFRSRVRGRKFGYDVGVRPSTTCKPMLYYKSITHEVHVVAKKRNLSNILLPFSVTNLRRVKKHRSVPAGG